MPAAQYRWWWSCLALTCVSSLIIQIYCVHFAQTTLTRRVIKVMVECIVTMILGICFSWQMWIDRCANHKRCALYGLNDLVNETSFTAHGTIPRSSVTDRIAIRLLVFSVCLQILWSLTWLVPMANQTSDFIWIVLPVEIGVRVLMSISCTIGIMCPWNDVDTSHTRASSPPSSSAGTLLHIKQFVISRRSNKAHDTSPGLDAALVVDNSVLAVPFILTL
jgi:hypothetical protein